MENRLKTFISLLGKCCELIGTPTLVRLFSLGSLYSVGMGTSTVGAYFFAQLLSKEDWAGRKNRGQHQSRISKSVLVFIWALNFPMYRPGIFVRHVLREKIHSDITFTAHGLGFVEKSVFLNLASRCGYPVAFWPGPRIVLDQIGVSSG